MAKIYGTAVCNVAASDADSDEKGCFFDRDETDVCSYVVALEDDSKRKHCIFREWEYTKQKLRSKPLAQRWWVFQESLLPA